MTILVTGAYGRVGTALIDHLHETYDFTYFDRVDHPSYRTIVGELGDYPEVSAAFEDARAVVHLAAASSVDASWPTVLRSNVIGGYNCFEAARRNEVERVVFASTNHVVGMYETEHAPQLYEPDYDLRLTNETPPRPDSHYATSKVFNEALARYYVENYDYPKRVYVLRFGSVRGPADDHPYADAEAGVERGEWARGSEAYRREVKRMKATWQSRRDAAQLVETCLNDESVVYDVFYGTSDNDRGWLDIDHARDVLGYRPRDSGDDWDEPPAGGTLPVADSAAQSLSE